MIEVWYQEHHDIESNSINSNNNSSNNSNNISNSSSGDVSDGLVRFCLLHVSDTPCRCNDDTLMQGNALRKEELSLNNTFKPALHVNERCNVTSMDSASNATAISTSHTAISLSTSMKEKSPYVMDELGEALDRNNSSYDTDKLMWKSNETTTEYQKGRGLQDDGGFSSPTQSYELSSYDSELCFLFSEQAGLAQCEPSHMPYIC